MRYLVAIVFILAALVACNSPEATAEKKTEPAPEDEQVDDEILVEGYDSYGEKISPDGAITVTELNKKVMDEGRVETVLEAEIITSCVKKGCWMTVVNPDGDEVRVTFKDYGFFVPTEGLEGKTAIMRGFGVRDTTSVADLQHYAEDAGKSAEEIAAITEPQISVSFEADGVLIK